MKNTKAKFLLTAIAVCAIVGGAMAFKANRGGLLYTYEGNNPAGACTVRLLDYTLTEEGSGVQTFASIQSTTDACPLTFITTLP